MSYNRYRTKEEEDRIALAFLKSKLTKKAYCEKIGISTDVLNSILRERHIKIKSNPVYTEEFKHKVCSEFVEIRKATDNQCPLKPFLKKYGISDHALYNWLKKYGYEGWQNTNCIFTRKGETPEPEAQEYTKVSVVKETVRAPEPNLCYTITVGSIQIKIYREMSEDSLIEIASGFASFA